MLQNDILKTCYSNCLQVYYPFVSIVVEVTKNAGLQLNGKNAFLKAK